MSILFEIKTYFEKGDIEERIRYYKKNPERLYVDIDDAENMKNIINETNTKGRNKFNLQHASTRILIKYNGRDIVNFYSPGDDNGLWLDYLNVIDDFLQHNHAVSFYGFEYYKMGIENFDDDKIHFYIMLEHENIKEISATLPKKEFLQELINALKYFLVKMDEYKVFEQKNTVRKYKFNFSN